MSWDVVIEVDNTPGALAHVAELVSDAGVNMAAATCLHAGDKAELHILVPHPEPVHHALAISHLGITREREVAVVEVEDRPGMLADLTSAIGEAGVSIDLIYVAMNNRVVFGSPDIARLKEVLGLA